MTERIDLDRLCEVMHDAYEKAARGAGWETNPASRVPWADVPESNKAAMRSAVTALLVHVDDIGPALIAEAQAGRDLRDALRALADESRAHHHVDDGPDGEYVIEQGECVDLDDLLRLVERHDTDGGAA